MDKIFHEKQEGCLCAQHCLNALLQGSYFTAVDLAELARQLDETERQTMAEGGATDEYQHFLNQPSSNFDDSGYFSIQVLQTALRVWALDLLPFTSSNDVASGARENPVSQNAYICNFKDHWFCVRKIGNQFFNLNSVLTGPELISDTYLSLFLTQLQQEGYSIFLVLGDLPETEADQLLRLMPVQQTVKPRLLSDSASTSSAYSEQDLAQALVESRRLAEEDDASLQRALALSVSEMKGESSGYSGHSLASSKSPDNKSSLHSNVETASVEEIRQRRLDFYTKGSTSSEPDNTEDTTCPDISEMSEEDMLKAALAMSMSKSAENEDPTSPS